MTVLFLSIGNLGLDLTNYLAAFENTDFILAISF